MIVVEFPGVWYSHSCLSLSQVCSHEQVKVFVRKRTVQYVHPVRCSSTANVTDKRSTSPQENVLPMMLRGENDPPSYICTNNTNFKILQPQSLELAPVRGWWTQLNCTTGLILLTIQRQVRKTDNMLKPITWTENLAYYGLFIGERSDLLSPKVKVKKNKNASIF